MTRCYEYYCLVNKDPKHPVCSDKAPATIRQVVRYIKALKEKRVLFDGSPADKSRFIRARQVLGTERSFCRKKTDNSSSRCHDSELIKEAMAYPVDELIQGLNAMSKTVGEWFNQCSSKSLFKLRRRIDNFYGTIFELKKALGIDDV